MVGTGEKAGWRKGPWTPEEDKLLSDYVSLHGEGRWSCVARCAGLNRSGKSCRLRWVNYLRPGLKRGHMTPQEEGIIIELHALWGNKWSTIARYLPGRTDNEIKNYWRTHFKKRPAAKTSCEKQERRKTSRKRNREQENDTTPQKNIINQQTTNDWCIAATTPPDYMWDDNTLATLLYEDIESWVDSFSMDGLWGGGLWNLDDSFYASAALEQSNDGSCKTQNQATTLIYPSGADHHTVNLWSGGYIF